jgi:hypothetical protein
MTDFRTIERDLIEFFDAADVNVVQIRGDHFAIVKPGCPCCGYEGISDGDGLLSITKLAERLAGK